MAFLAYCMWSVGAYGAFCDLLWPFVTFSDLLWHFVTFRDNFLHFVTCLNFDELFFLLSILGSNSRPVCKNGPIPTEFECWWTLKLVTDANYEGKTKHGPHGKRETATIFSFISFEKDYLPYFKDNCLFVLLFESQLKREMCNRLNDSF